MANEPWASDANYPAGSDPWSGTPTKSAPGLSEIAAGHIPGEPDPAEVENWWKNRADTRASRMEALFDASGRIDRLYRDWANQKESITFEQNGTGDASADFASLMQGNVLSLSCAAGADWARGRTDIIMAPPQLAAYLQVLEWDVDATDLAGAGPADCDLYMGIMDLGAYDNGKGSVVIYKSAASANWKILHNATAPGGSETIVDTGVPVSAVAIHRMRIEWIGSGYTGGAKANFYIDDVLVHTAVANLPNNAAERMYVAFDLLQTGADGATVYISPFTWRQARSVADGNALLNL